MNKPALLSKPIRSIFISMKVKEKSSGFSRKEKDQTLRSLISSFRIENIHISESEAAEIYKKVSTRIKKLAV